MRVGRRQYEVMVDTLTLQGNVFRRGDVVNREQLGHQAYILTAAGLVRSFDASPGGDGEFNMGCNPADC